MRLKSVSAKTHQGPYFEINEDFYQIDLTNNLFMVLDGFGGSGAGDSAVKKISERMMSFYVQVSEDPDSTMPFFYSPRYLIEGNALVNAMVYTHKSVLRENISLEVSKRGGASAAFFTLADNIATIGLVGNIFCFLVRNGEVLRPLIADNARFLTKGQGGGGSIPTSAFGLFDDLYYQVKEIRPLEGDKVLIATDGAIQGLSLNELSSITSDQNLDLNTRILKIFDLANQRGNYDNQSAMILEF